MKRVKALCFIKSMYILYIYWISVHLAAEPHKSPNWDCKKSQDERPDWLLLTDVWWKSYFCLRTDISGRLGGIVTVTRVLILTVHNKRVLV